jgi:hypothetical protein
MRTEVSFCFLLQYWTYTACDTEQNNAPTAEQVFRVFSGASFPPPPPSSSSSEDEGREDGIEEVDFNDMGKLLESLVVATTTATSSHPSRVNEGEEVFTGYFPNAHAQVPNNGDGDRGGDEETVLEIDFTELDKLTLIEGGTASDLDALGREDVSMQEGAIAGALDSTRVSATDMDEVVTQSQSEGITIQEEDIVLTRNDAVSGLGVVSDQRKGDGGSMWVDESVNAASLSTRVSDGSTTASSSTIFLNERTTAFSSKSTRRETSIATVEAGVLVEEQLEPVAKPSSPGTADEGNVSAEGTNVLHAGEPHIVTDTSIEVETLDVQMTSKSTGTIDMDTTTTPTQPPGTGPAIPSLAKPGQDVSFFVDVVPEPVAGGSSLPTQPQPDDSDDEEIIVYVAPHPRRLKPNTHTQTEQAIEKEKDTSRFEPYVGLSQTTSVNEPSFPLASTSSHVRHNPNSHHQSQSQSQK